MRPPKQTVLFHLVYPDAILTLPCRRGVRIINGQSEVRVRYRESRRYIWLPMDGDRDVYLTRG